MSALHELIAQVQDDKLRGQLQAEFNKLRDEKTFGLVFESSAEFFPRADLPVKKNSLVAKVGDIDKTFRVTDIDGDKIFCARDKKTLEFSRQDLICVSRLGEAIYPGLTKLDEVCNAPDSSLWHMLIEAENYHALQLLKYPFAGKVDCIYIDPPYNTGARDWKYNNAFVDAADRFSHSKWLSMMERRLKLAKDLLNPANSVLIVTIDEHEYLHLGCLLEELFGGARIQMVTIVTNPFGQERSQLLARVEEYAFFVFFGKATASAQVDDLLNIRESTTSAQVRGEVTNGNHSRRTSVRWEWLLRGGADALRKNNPKLFYPVFVDVEKHSIHGVGEPLAPEIDRNVVVAPEGCVAVWPIKTNGVEGRWRCSPDYLRELIDKGCARVGEYDKANDRHSILYLSKATMQRIETGEIEVLGKDSQSALVLGKSPSKETLVSVKTVWNRSSHRAGEWGTRYIRTLLPGRIFPFPKSLYAVRDTLKIVLDKKPDALIVDFFAGSGTTLHAVNLLNAEDGGRRRCVLVTNNEGDIARSVTWPRTVCSVEGHDINGAPLKGNYLGTEREMSAGFKANAAFFALNCLDKNSVELGEQFNQTLPVLWLKAGGHGRCPTFEAKTLPPYKIFAENKFAVLFDESHFADFANEVDNAQIETLFAVTGSDASLNDMTKQLRVKRSFRLYEDYLENFKLEEAEP